MSDPSPLAITVRPAQPRDRPTLVALMAQLQDTERTLYPRRPPGSQIAAAHFTYLETVVRAQRGQIYVADVTDVTNELKQNEGEATPPAPSAKGAKLGGWPSEAGQPWIAGFLVCFVESYAPGDCHVAQADRQYGYISDLYVVEAMRQAGIATALMTAAEQYFQQLNLAIVRVGLLFSNQVAKQFYGKVGYQPYEVIYEKRIQGLNCP